MKQSFHHREAGSALIYIFIGVALFGALMFVFARGASQNSNSVSSAANARIIASDILSYTKAVENAVNRLLSRGCSETQLNFENTVVAGYANASAPVDNSCDLFDAAGGKLKWETVAAVSGSTDDWVITGESCVKDVGLGDNSCASTNGASDSDLVMAISGINLDVCLQINATLGIDNPSGAPPAANGLTWTNPPVKFQGAFTEGGHAVQSDASGTDILRGKTAGCFDGDTFPASGTYTYYKVILAR